ncbi:MAG: GLPGLI family protein, partial [Gemmatimonadetes bacterium]|nr:GLPGLI family protein [Gemmatimonadota bacterium]
MKKLLTLALLLLPVTVSAQQQGVILFDRQVQYGFEVPEDLKNRPQLKEMLDAMPPAHFASLLLLFDESASLLTPVPEPEPEVAVSDAPRAAGLVMRLKMGSSSRSDQEEFLDTYVRYEDGMIAETRDFMTRQFLLTGTRPAYQWKLTGEQSEFLGYAVQKATAVQDSSMIEAWFTPEIPVPAGPGPYGGLPGMILSVSVNDGQTLYSATEVKLETVDASAIKAPVDGDQVS